MTDEAFCSLPEASRRALLEIGPLWAKDIVKHRRQVLDAYTPVLAQVPRDGIETVRNLRYGTDPRHCLDIYRRKDSVNAPIVIFVHGGAFIRGEKDSNAEIYGNVPRYFARHGCIGINVEYRLAPHAPYPAGAEDVALAVAWIRLHAREYGGNPDHIILFGHSAGGAHAGAYICDPLVRPQAGHGVAGLILISARLRADARPDNPNANAVRAYYGADETLYETRSVTAHAHLLDVPVFLAIAQYENPYLDAYAAEFAWRVGMARGQMPRLLQLPAHNHTSIVAHFDSGEELLPGAALEFVRLPA